MLKGNDTALLLSAARELIADEKNWCKNVLQHTERTIKFQFMPPFYKEVINEQFCARGALINVIDCNPIYDIGLYLYGSNMFLKLDGLLNFQVMKLFPEQVNIATVNNNIGHKAVLKCFDAAIKEAQETF